MISVVRIYSDESGESHFQDVEVPLKDSGMVGKLSDEVKAKSLIFREVTPSYDWDFHCAPQRQYIVLLDGEIEIETSLGKKRKFQGGDILLVSNGENTDNKNNHDGHDEVYMPVNAKPV